MEEFMVSVVVPTYNHEKYIAKALDSVLMQKTQYSYEVLVGEDVSTDGTAAVLRQYEKDHPGRITVFYRDHNMYNEKCANAQDLRRRARGKYLITLEGDDYWLSDQKLERQVAFLESHPDYVAVAHNCLVVDENDQPTGEKYPECKNEEYSLGEYLAGIYPGQLATLMSRNFIREDLFDPTILERRLTPGDKLLYFGLVTNGKIHCIQEPMTAYRHVRNKGSSYSANYRYQFEKDEHWYFELLDFARKQKKGQDCVEALYFGCLLHGMKQKQLSFKGMLRYRKNMDHPFRALLLFVKRMYLIHIRKSGAAN